MNKRILIIDDDQALCLLYQTELKAAGYDVTSVHHVDDGLKSMAEVDYALVLLDIEMPEISGLEALRELREVAPDAKVILNSAYSEYKVDFTTWLADEYLIKSSDLQPLIETIDRLLAV